MGLMPQDFYSLTWVEYHLKSKGFTNARYKQWEHTRLIAYTIASANRDPKKSFPSIEQFMPLPTDSSYESRESRVDRLKKKLREFKGRLQ
jgi:hypothetical protein